MPMFHLLSFEEAEKEINKWDVFYENPLDVELDGSSPGSEPFDFPEWTAPELPDVPEKVKRTPLETWTH